MRLPACAAARRCAALFAKAALTCQRRPDTPGTAAAEAREDAFNTGNFMICCHVSVFDALVLPVYWTCRSFFYYWFSLYECDNSSPASALLNRNVLQEPKPNGIASCMRAVPAHAARCVIQVHRFCRAGTRWTVSLTNGIMFLNGSQ